MSHPIEQLPARVGPFEITGILGEGGMGVVYSARNPSSGDRVAVKTVPVVDATLLSTLRREVHALSRLAHPGVVRVLATGFDAGRPWYAMELLEGTTLAGLRDALWGDGLGRAHPHLSIAAMDRARTVPILKRPLVGDEMTAATPGPRARIAGGQLARVLTITRRLLGSLAFIHGEGIIHRDLKPQNVFLRPGDLPVLVDFGLASRSAGTTGREVLDDAVEVVGTPAYMAPEQIRADVVDSRADLYALGCVLYELLTGRPPFVGTATSIMEHHLTVVPAPPSALVDGCPQALDELVLELLEKRPRDRVGHALDAIYALDELGVESEAAPAGRPPAYVYRPALVGRDEAKEEIERAARAASQGKGGCVLIAGESGMGKTYLAMEAARTTISFRILSGTCAQVGTFHHGPGGQPLHAFARLFETIIDRCSAEGRAETDRLLGARGRILSAHEPALARLPGQDAYPEPPPLSGAAARDRLLGALSDTVAALAEERPLLILIDDLQWADEVSLRFLNAMADDWFEGKRVLILGTYRIEEATPAITELAARPYTREVRLQRLEEPVVRSLICDMLAVDAPPDGFVRFLARHSEGNPFFVAEYLRTATAEGLIRRGAGKRLRIGSDVVVSDSSSNLRALQLPLTMPELVGRRLDGLSATARALSDTASVIGREFDPEVLRNAAGVSEGEAMEGIAELIARQIVESTEHGGLRFVHDKLCEIAYDRQPVVARRALHDAVATAIESRWPEPERARFHAVLAHHFQAAEVEDKAIEYLEKAGEHALAHAAYAEARDLHQKLLALDDRRTAAGVGAVEPRRRARWARRLGEASFNLGDLAGCEEASLAAMRLLGRPVPASRAGWLAGIVRMAGTQTLHRFGIGVDRRTAADDRDDLRELARAASVMAWRYFFIDDMIGVVSMSLLSVNEIESASPPMKVASPYAWLGYTAGFARLHGLARTYFREAYVAADETGDVAGGHFAALMEALYHVGFANWSEVERLNRRALAALRDAGDPTNAEHHLTCLANMEFYVGRFAESARHFEQILAAARARRNWQIVAWGLYASCKGMIAQGRFAESLPRLDEAKRLLDTLSDAASQIICHGLYALVYTRQGDDAAARAMADEASQRIHRSRAVVYSTIMGYIGCAETYLELLDRARRAGTPASVAELTGLAARACTDLGRFSLLFPFAGPAALRYRGQLHALRGRERAARRAFERSIALSRRLHMPYDEAQALWLAARYLPAGRGDPRLVDAAHLFERLDCAWHLDRVRALRS